MPKLPRAVGDRLQQFSHSTMLQWLEWDWKIIAALNPFDVSLNYTEKK